MSKINIIAAVAKNWGIGYQGGIPWKLSADMKQFKKLTMGENPNVMNTVVMGRKTFQSLPKGPLPGRVNVVLTRDVDFSYPDVVVLHSFEDVLKMSDGATGEIFIIGGEQVYKDALPYADRMYLTLVSANPQCDAFFPKFDAWDWDLVLDEMYSWDEKNEYSYRYYYLERGEN